LATWKDQWVRTATASYKGHRYLVEVINYCVWLYFQFPLSFREVEELMLQRGVVVSYETIGAGMPSSGRLTPTSCAVDAPAPATNATSTRSSSKINGKIHYLWRAVDQHGNVFDILVQRRRNTKAAKKFFRRLRKGLRYVPRVIVTDKLASYQAAHRVVMPSVASSPVEVPEQSRRELPSAHPATRAGDETLHIS